MDSLPPTVMAARFRGTERRLDDEPAGAFSSSVPKRPPDVTARVVFSLSVLVKNKNIIPITTPVQVRSVTRSGLVMQKASVLVSSIVRLLYKHN